MLYHDLRFGKYDDIKSGEFREFWSRLVTTAKIEQKKGDKSPFSIKGL